MEILLYPAGLLLCFLGGMSGASAFISSTDRKWGLTAAFGVAAVMLTTLGSLLAFSVI